MHGNYRKDPGHLNKTANNDASYDGGLGDVDYDDDHIYGTGLSGSVLAIPILHIYF